MKLGTINDWLRRVGLVLVVSHPLTERDYREGEGVKLWIERARTYDRRPRAPIPTGMSTAYPRDLS